MRGLSEEDVRLFIRAHNLDEEHNWIAGALLEECHELDPWLPIESAPKDKIIWLYTRDLGQIAGYWSNNPQRAPHISNWQDRRGVILHPTHYKELLKDPKE